MILQTGQRTDIPAFYGQWLINRVRQGFVDVRNPYNPIQITRYPINHEVVDGIAFCTKNPLPFIPSITKSTCGTLVSISAPYGVIVICQYCL